MSETSNRTDSGSKQTSARPFPIPSPAGFTPFAFEDVDQSVASRIEQVAALHPKRVALARKHQRVSYEQLNGKANQIAHAVLTQLPHRSYTRSDANPLKTWEREAEPVAVFLDQGIQAVCAILGLLKAGKVFVSIDPSDPDTRNGFILRHAPAKVVLTEEKYLDRVRRLTSSDCKIIRMEALDPALAETNPELPIDADDPAILVYTSGSTGQPKGVVHTQRNLLHDCYSKTDLMKFAPEDKVALLAWATGQAIKVIFCALLNGAALCPFDLKKEGLSPLANWLKAMRISVLTLSAPICRSLLHLLKQDDVFPGIRLVRTASDVVYPRDIARMKPHFGPDCCYVNALASNETGIVCAYVWNGTTPLPVKKIPVGRPINDVRIRLLDEDGKPVPIQDTGLVAVTSRYIARGYWRNPALTEKVFSIHPADPHQITFKSADLARWQPNGNLELSGRNDFRVKIRGYRVETAEVEAALLDHDNIVEAVVHPCENDEGDKRLAGYIVPHHHPAPSTNDLYHFLKSRLTDYMIPATFLTLAEIPRLSNGKTNRRALPPPGNQRPDFDHAYVAPATETEHALVEIWSQVTGIDGIGVHDPFFELGGDSLQAGQVMARILDTFHMDLPLRILFEASTVAEMANLIDGGKNEGQRRPEFALERRPGPGPWPLSSGQKRLWFLYQLDKASPAYNMPKLIRLEGALNQPALVEALRTMVDRHEVLRTHYVSNQGIPEAVVADTWELSVPFVDLTTHPTGQRFDKLQEAVAETSVLPFDLEKDLMLRCTLYRLDTGLHVLLCLTHHIASDGWSRGILMRELFTHYQAFAAGEPSPMEPLPVQYSDFARWQTERRQSSDMRSQKDYWLERLKDLPPALELATDHPRPTTLTSKGRAHSILIPKDQLQLLEAMATECNVTLFMLLLAAFEVLLHRCSGQEDLVIGCPVAGRSLTETEDLIGFFVNSLVLRMDLSGNPTFLELLERVRKETLDAYSNREFPFEHLVRKVGIGRDLSRNPLFQISFDVHRPRSPVLQSDQVAFKLMEVNRQTSPFDQAWNIAVLKEGLRVRVEYSTDLFDTETIARLTEQFSVLLQDMVENQDKRISSMNLARPDQFRLLFQEWNQTDSDYPRDKSVVDLFEEQASLRPDAVAVQFPDNSLSYAALNERSDLLAARLIELGLEPEGRVALFAEPRAERMVALLAILKAGGAYVPLDPDYPEERIRFIVEDVQASLVITTRKLEHRIPDGRAKIVRLEDDWHRPAKGGETRTLRKLPPSQLAYILYTSGSTGEPKGVCIEHQAIIPLVRNTDYIEITPDDRVAQASNVAFDAATFEIWGALLNGARLVGIDKEVLLKPGGLKSAIEAHGITILFLTTALFNQIAGETPETFSNLQTLLVGGEQADARSMRKVLNQGPPGRLLNVYGPTETTTFSSWFEIVSLPGKDEAVPIGKPLANQRLYLMDTTLNPVPCGVVGELCIGGAGLARGYWRRPDLTARQFQEHEDLGRIYRTGDLCRRDRDGTIHFMGRLDNQVKIRGFRIELGEIEYALSRHPAIGRCVVRVKEKGSKNRLDGEKHLTAYFETRDETTMPAPSDLRNFLSKTLPAYSIPAFYVRLSEFPLTPNGKINDKALPPPLPNHTHKQLDEPITTDSLEDRLTDIWKEVLKVKDVRVSDNFFELGGHSINAMRLVARIQSVLDRELNIRDLFEYPTVAELARHLESQTR